MKIAITLVSLLLGVSCVTQSNVETLDVGPKYPEVVVEGDEAFFRFDANYYLGGSGLVEQVGITGTFDGWMDLGNFPLSMTEEPGIWAGRFPLEIINVPGNSGMPEFQFTLDGVGRVMGFDSPGAPVWGSNFVILIPPETPESLEQKDQINRTIINDYPDQETLSNFRSLSGGDLASGILNRSYHPFIPSRTYPSEGPRLEAVQELMESRGIAAVINLTDKPEVGQGSEMNEYYRFLDSQGKVGYAPTEYNQVYFHPDGPEFQATLRQVMGFMAENEGPYLIHCRLGTDRTGVVTGILEALAGVPWDQILFDYELSNRMGIREYRSGRLLEYSFQKMLGQAPSEIPNLQEAMRSYVLGAGVSPIELDRVLDHLSL